MPEEKAVSVSLPLLPLEGRGPILTSDGKNLYKGLLYKPVKNLLKAKAYIFVSEHCVLLFEYRTVGPQEHSGFQASYFPSTSISVFTLK